MEDETKGLKGAVARLRAELHSLALGGAAIVVEVNAEQWHKLRQAYAAATDATELVLVADQVNGDVVFRLKREPGKQIQLEQLGLQPPTVDQRVELLEKTLRNLIADDTRQITISAQIGKQVNERLADLELVNVDHEKRLLSLESWRAMSP